MVIEQKLGMKIVEIRKSRKLSQMQVAERVQISRRYLSDIENGTRNVSLDVVERIASVLGIQLSVLFVSIGE